MPLIEKEIFIANRYTKKNIYDNQPNMFINLNDTLINVNEQKIKNLNLNKYINK